jgi:YYY domain-containing protein
MLFDWLAREGWVVFNWWLLSSAFGLTVLPLLVRLVPALQDRGYTLMRVAGWLSVGIVFWLMGVLGLVNNSVGSILLAWAVVAGVSISVYLNVQSHGFSWRVWWRENRGTILRAEILFIVLLFGFALFRAVQNDYTGTEKPMDLAFMNAIMQSDNLPPNDPWLSGYSISYYYFGYLLSAMNAMLVGVPGAVGYNMHLALLFALTGVTTFGIGYNLVRSNRWRPAGRFTGELTGMLAMIFVLFLSNFHMPIVDIPYQSRAFDDAYYRFWDTKSRVELPKDRDPVTGEVIIDDATGDPVIRGAVSYFDPANASDTFLWWFDAARTITERRLPVELSPGDYYDANPFDGQPGIRLTEPLTLPDERVNEVIDEFPAFSFLLGDSHPHVMALPFALLSLGLAVSVLYASRSPVRWQVVIYGVWIGALVFLNTWDVPVYIIVIVGAEMIRRMMKRGVLHWSDIVALFGFGLALLGITLVVYLPFIVGFESQLGGILPNVLYPTRPQQMFLMFGPFILLLAVYLGVELWRGWRQQAMNWYMSLSLTLGVLLALGILMGLLVTNGTIDPTYRDLLRQLIPPPGTEPALASSGAWGAVNAEILERRIITLPTLLMLVLALVIVFGRLLPMNSHREDQTTYNPASAFALLLIGCAVGLVLIPEFVYLRDNFSTRMNTVFKFYYQAWVLLGVASAYAVYWLIFSGQAGRVLRYAYGALTVIVLGAGLLYFAVGVYSRTFIETGLANNAELVLSLDGRDSFTSPLDYQAIQCLEERVGDRQVVVAEAMPQGQRTNYNSNHARVGSLTGIPVVMGWPGHQSQWRGQSYGEAVGTRPDDLNQLFTADSIAQIRPILRRYEIDYILYGSTEQLHYGAAGEQKFLDNFELVCDASEISSGGGARSSRVYRVPELTNEFLTDQLDEQS